MLSASPSLSYLQRHPVRHPFPSRSPEFTAVASRTLSQLVYIDFGLQTRLQLSTPQGVCSERPLLQSFAQLKDVRVVLTSPKVAGNIGAVARAAENFEVSQLVVVDPRCNPWDGEAHKIACGSSLMQSMIVVPTLQEALTDTPASIGFTRRAGNTRLVHSSLSQLLQMFPHTLPNPGAQATHSQSAAKGKIALVFGREESGLTESELSLCTHSCSIPTGTLQPSLNLSHAVCVILAQLYEQRDSSCNTGAATSMQQLPKQHQPAARQDIDTLIQRWTDLSRAVGLGGEDSVGGTGSHGRKRRTAGHVKAVLSRAQITTQEVRALQGLCSALIQKLRPEDL